MQDASDGGITSRAIGALAWWAAVIIVFIVSAGMEWSHATRIQSQQMDGDAVTVPVTQYPGREFRATVTRHPEALAPDTRTMRVEIDLPNIDSAPYPGMYATVRLDIASADRAVGVPDDALVFRDGRAYVPLVQNDRIHLARIRLGNDDGREVEVAGDLAPGA